MCSCIKSSIPEFLTLLLLTPLTSTTICKKGLCSPQVAELFQVAYSVSYNSYNLARNFKLTIHYALD